MKPGNFYIIIFLIFSFSCEPYEYILGDEIENPDKVSSTDLIVYIYNGTIFTTNTSGENVNQIPNTEDAHNKLSINNTKRKIAYSNTDNELVVINLDGSDKKILSNSFSDFEWSKTEDVLLVIDSNKLETLEGSSTITFPNLIDSFYINNFTFNENYDLAITYHDASDKLWVSVILNDNLNSSFKSSYLFANRITGLEFNSTGLYLSGVLESTLGNKYFYGNFKTFLFDGVFNNNELNRRLYLEQQEKYYAVEYIENRVGFADGYNLVYHESNNASSAITFYDNNNSPIFFDRRE